MIWLAGLALVGAHPVIAARQDYGFASEWFRKNVISRVTITGHRVLGYHASQVSGDKSTFGSLTYYGQGGKPFTSYGQVELNARKVMGVLSFRASIANDNYSDPQAQKASVDFEQHGLTLHMLDVRPVLPCGNEFTPMGRNSRGIVVGYATKLFAIGAYETQARSATRTVTMQGNGSSGPYYLGVSQIVSGSERILVDGQQQTLGTDYTIDYQTGTVTFVTRIVAQTSSIVASFETLSVNSRNPGLRGIGAKLNLGKLGAVGVATVSQTQASGSALSTRTEYFQGYGDPATPYTLSYQPLANQPFIVKVDGLLQVLDVDYYIDTTNTAVFYFRRYIPNTSTVQVTYTPQPTAGAEGKRHVFGFDWAVPFSNLGALHYSQATGGVSGIAGARSGVARSLAASYKLKGWDLSGAWHDVPGGFTTVQSASLGRNERSWLLSANSKRGIYSTELTAGNSRLATTTTDGTGDVSYLSTRVVSFGMRLTGTPKRSAAWTLEQKRLTSGGYQGNSQIDSTDYATSRSHGRLSTTLHVGRLSGWSRAAADTARTQFTSQTVSSDLTYVLGRSWDLSGKIGLSNTAAGSESRTGYDSSLSVGFRPEKGRFSWQASAIYSRSGQVAALTNFLNGFTAGYGANGFSTGVTTTSAQGIASDARVFQTVANYRASRRLNLDARFSRAYTAGSTSSNSDGTSFGFDAQADLGRGHTMWLSLGHSETDFVSANASRSTATTLDLSANGPVAKRWNYRLGLSQALSSGGAYAQNNLGVDATLSRMLSRRQSLAVFYSNNFTTGYLPQAQSSMGMTYTYRLYNNVGLTGALRWRRLGNSDGTTSGSYRARSLDLEMTFDFGS